jgi:hypothetical protein
VQQGDGEEQMDAKWDLMYAEGIWGGAFGNPDRRMKEIELYNGAGY